MKNPFTTIAESADRIEALERDAMRMVDTLAVHGADMLELLGQDAQSSQAMDIAGRRTRELEQSSAAQLARIESLEGCIRTQSGLPSRRGGRSRFSPLACRLMGWQQAWATSARTSTPPMA